MSDMAAVKVLKNALCFIMGYFVAMETYVMLLLLVEPRSGCETIVLMLYVCLSVRNDFKRYPPEVRWFWNVTLSEH